MNAFLSAESLDITLPCETSTGTGLVAERTSDASLSSTFEDDIFPGAQVDALSRPMLMESDHLGAIWQASTINQEYASHDQYRSSTPQLDLAQQDSINQEFRNCLDYGCSTPVPQTGLPVVQGSPTSPLDPFIPTPTSARPLHGDHEYPLFNCQGQYGDTTLYATFMENVSGSRPQSHSLPVIKESIWPGPTYYSSQSSTTTSQSEYLHANLCYPDGMGGVSIGYPEDQR